MKETEKKTKKQYKRTDAPKGQVAQIKEKLSIVVD